MPPEQIDLPIHNETGESAERTAVRPDLRIVYHGVLPKNIKVLMDVMEKQAFCPERTFLKWDRGLD
jgi:hypothetical protein